MRRIIITMLFSLLALFPGLVSAQTLTSYEYWFDDDVDGRLTGTMSGTNDAITLNVDARGLSQGVHRLNFRARQSDGMYSAVSTSVFIKVAAGVGNKLEYWIDDERSNVNILEGSLASDGKDYLYNDTLDLGDVTPGYHRLYCRARSSSGRTTSAVSMSPIIVKSRYYNDENEPVTVRHYSISVDDEEPMVHDVLDPEDEYKYNRKLDARYLSQGQHTLKATFWNSVGTSVSVEQPFTVKVPEPGEIMLTATEHDGMVKLEYNNVPNNLNHSLLRSKPGESWFPVHTVKESCSDDIVSHFIDIPSAAGTYVYKVRDRYEKFDGSTAEVTSNEVTVNVARTQDELTNYGYIIGQVPDMYPLFKHAYFSDGEHVSFTGNHFSREMIPVGKELTIEVMESSDSETYYKPVTLTVHAGENVVNFETLTDSQRPYYDEHHLEFASDLEWTGMNFIFDVKNHGRNPWRGKVRLRAISKKEAEQPDGDDGNGDITPGGDGNAGTQAGAVAPMPNVNVEKNYYYAYSEPLFLQKGETATVTLSLDNLFPDDKKEHYLCFFESEGQWSDGVHSMDEVRLVAINRANNYNVTENPMDRLIDKSLLEQAKDEIAKQDAEYAANLILMIAGYINSFDGILGKIDEFSKFTKTASLMEYHLDGSQYDAMLESALNAETWDEFIHSDVVKNAPITVLADLSSEITETLRQDIVHDIIKYGKGVNEYLGKAMTVLKYVKQYKEWKDMNEYDKTFYCAEAILDFAEKKNPFFKLVKPYVEVGKSMIAKALEYGEIYNSFREAQDLYEGKVHFYIMVQTNSLVDFNFAWHGTSAIREVKVMAANRDDWNNTMVDTIYFEPEGVFNAIKLKQTKYVGTNPSTGNGHLEESKPLQRLWMEIKWKNGRTSKVPLVGKNDEPGVSYYLGTYIVHFTSGSYKYENIADIIHLSSLIF